MIVIALLLAGGGAAAAPVVEYQINGANDEVTGITGGKRAWELRDSLGGYFNYRIAANNQAAFRYKDEARVVHNLAVDSRNVGLLMDWHPLAGHFRLSGGLYSYKLALDYIVAPEVDELIEFEFNLDQESIAGLAEDLQELGVRVELEDLEAYLPEDGAARAFKISQRIEFDATDLSIQARVKYKNVAPYAGFGWSTPFSSGSRLRYSFDIGVLHQIDPEIDVIMYGDVFDEPNPSILAWLDEWSAEQKQKLQGKLHKNRFSPRIGFGLSYRLY